MNYLYVSTDPKEAQAIIEPDFVNKPEFLYNSGTLNSRFEYHNIRMKDGETLSARVGFNPMISIEFDDSVKNRDIETIVERFLKRGILVTLESGGKIQHYRPPDIDVRNELVKLSLQKYGHSAWCLLFYSNYPHKINPNISV